MAATERIPVLVTAQEKNRIAEMAKASGLSMGEYLRRAAESFRPSESEEDKMLDGMIEQMVKTTTQASAAIDDALAFVAASNKRIAALDVKRKIALSQRGMRSQK